jgi:hypothetical protein
MTTNKKTLATTIHDAINDVTTAVEDVHKSVADLPLDVLAGITPLKAALDEVRAAQARSIGALYDLVRKVNARVRRLTAGAPPR